MADAKSNYLERKVLDHVLGTTAFSKPANVYVGLFTSDPTDANGGIEANGGGYERKAVTFDPASTNVEGITTAVNNNTLSWTNMPGGTYTHTAIFTSQSAGEMLYHAQLTSPKTLSSGDSFAQNPGQIVVKEN